MERRVDLNCDMGESFGMYKLGLDEEAVKYITSANIACGFHAGDAQVMDKTVSLAKTQGVAVGAHPSYPDLQGFGRRKMDATPQEVKNYMIYQIGALQAFAKSHGVKLQHVKPHGAVYNTAAVDHQLARAIAEAIYQVDKDLIFLTLAGSEMEKAAAEVGLKSACEVFADRNYNSNGTLLSRKKPGAVITDSEEVGKRVVDMVVKGQIIACDGTVLPVKADSICVHGDTPGAIEHIKHIRQALENANVNVTSMGNFIK